MRLVLLARILFFSGLSAVGLFLAGCEPATEQQPARLKISMIDSPGDFEEVNIEITEIKILFSEGDWIQLTDFKPGVYNLLDYTAGQELSISESDAPFKTLTKLMLTLGENNTVRIKGQPVDLNIPNGQDNKVLIYIHQDLEPGTSTDLILDFDASRSVVRLSNTGIYILKPVIKAFNIKNTGSISGTVLPDQLNVAVQVISNGQVVASSYSPDNSSSYVISGLPEGEYLIVFDPGSNSGYQQHASSEYIRVTNGNVTHVETVTLQSEIN